MNILSLVKKRIQNMNSIDHCILLGIIIGFVVFVSALCSTFKEINTQPNTVPIESTNIQPVVSQPSPLSSQTIDINVNPDPTTISNSKSNLPFYQEINISGSNTTITINNYDGNVK